MSTNVDNNPIELVLTQPVEPAAPGRLSLGIYASKCENFKFEADHAQGNCEMNQDHMLRVFLRIVGLRSPGVQF